MPTSKKDLARLTLLGRRAQPSKRLEVFPNHAPGRRYTVTLVTNAGPDTLDVSAMTVAPGATTIAAQPLGLAWPAEMYSLSHIALPFAEDDPVYGGAGKGKETGSVSLGRLVPRGEKDVLIVSAAVV